MKIGLFKSLFLNNFFQCFISTGNVFEPKLPDFHHPGYHPFSKMISVTVCEKFCVKTFEVCQTSKVFTFEYLPFAN